MAALIRPAEVAKITAIQFTGNRALASAVLESTMNPVVLGHGYTEYDLRAILPLNLVPLYEEQGYLTLKFLKIGFQPAAGDPSSTGVTVVIDDGAKWTLGAVDITGDTLPVDEMRKVADLPIGKTANWKLILQGLVNSESVLQHQGYLHPGISAVRQFQSDGSTVNLEVKVNKGKQSFFGKLILTGLSDEDQVRATKKWELAEGAVMDGLYMGQYLKGIGKALKGPYKSVSSTLRARPGTNIVDAAVTFK